MKNANYEKSCFWVKETKLVTYLIAVKSEQENFRQPRDHIGQAVHGQDLEADPDARVRNQIALFIRQQEEGSQLSRAVNQWNFFVAKIADSASNLSWKTGKFVSKRLGGENRDRVLKFLTRSASTVCLFFVG